MAPRSLTVKSLPDSARRSGRVTAAALIKSESRSLRILRAAVQREADALVARLVGVDSQSAATSIVRASMVSIAGAITSAVIESRQGARVSSLDRLRTELRGLLQETALPILTDEDRAAADVAAQAFAAAWGSAQLMASWSWSEGKEKSAAAAAKIAAERIDYRTRRMAATETAQAFQDVRSEAEEYYLEQRKQDSALPLPLKVWDATLDKRVCSRCSPLDGTIRPWGMAFGGLEPGYVHANCRCISWSLILPVTSEQDEAA